jgi:hypothetical protein
LSVEHKASIKRIIFLRKKEEIVLFLIEFKESSKRVRAGRGLEKFAVVDIFIPYQGNIN